MDAAKPIYLLGTQVDFILFGLALIGVAIFHHKTLEVALTALAAIVSCIASPAPSSSTSSGSTDGGRRSRS